MRLPTSAAVRGGIDASRAEIHEFADLGLRGGMNDVRADRTIVVKKLGGPAGICENAADRGGSEEYRIRPIGRDPVLDGVLPT
jgi:hypothetical protein